MDAFLQQFEDLRIQLEEIKSATNNFDDAKNYIGGGGFGKVYKGEVSHSEGRSMVAIKRLDRKHGQGIPEFLKEITMLSCYKHENLISLLGFCSEEDEMILVYEHASRGSLDLQLNSPHLKWSQRLKICLDAAKGLSYLHDPRETHQRLIHCDVKSANILLDDQWNAKVSDFGLSTMGPANQPNSIIVTFVVGTPGYYDPQYAMTHTLTKESDVYSLGVVLFEVLCGRLCCTYKNNGHVQQILVPAWIESYEKKNLNDIIFKNPNIQPLDPISLKIFSDIVYRCLKESREDRPKMAEVVTELETALEKQEFKEWELLSDYDDIIKNAEPPLVCRSKAELRELLSKGILLKGGKTWFSLNKKGEHCEMISFAKCVEPGIGSYPSSSTYTSRFPVGPYQYKKDQSVNIHVNTQFLSPGTTYVTNLVFKFYYRRKRRSELILLKYKLRGDKNPSIAYLAYEREDGWWICELYQFTSDHNTVDLEIVFDGFDPAGKSFHALEVEGIEFQPLEKVEHKSEKQPISYPNANWKEKLPADYEDIMKWSKNRAHWTMKKKEAYPVIHKGFLVDDGKKWFSLDKNGKKSHMIPARGAVDMVWKMDILPLPELRFGEAVQCDSWKLCINSVIPSQLVSTETTYASYIVYKLSKDHSGFEAPMLVVDTQLSSHYWYIYLVSPQIPDIRPKADQNTHNTFNKLKIKGLPRHRKDGWMEVEVWEFRTATTPERISMRLKLATCGNKMLSGLIIQGVEYRPI